MDASELYSAANGLQKNGLELILKEYFNVIRWQDGDRILDVGCGPGDLTAEIISKNIPCQWLEIVGMDLNSSMIEYACNNYSQKGITFIQGDIAKSEPPLKEKFHKILSFYCLHWVHNHSLVARNLFEMLYPGGEVLLVFFGFCPIYEAYETFFQTKWGSYMLDYKNFISPFHYSSNPCEDVKKIYQEPGFYVKNVHLKSLNYTFETTDILRKSLLAINPFMKRIPNELHDNYISDFMELILTNSHIDEKEIDNNGKMDSYKNIKIHYNLIIVHLFKS